MLIILPSPPANSSLSSLLRIISFFPFRPSWNNTTQRDSANALELQLEQPRRSLAASVPFKPFFFACSELFRHVGMHRLFHRITRQPEVQRVGDHLDQLEIAPVYKLNQTILVKLQDLEHGHLVDRDPYLKGPVDFHLQFCISILHMSPISSKSWNHTKRRSFLMAVSRSKTITHGGFKTTFLPQGIAPNIVLGYSRLMS